jgi:hypothetical protein
MCSHSYNTKVLPRDGLVYLDGEVETGRACPGAGTAQLSGTELSSFNLLPR